MKVGELIKLLQEQDPELLVLVDGPEFGLVEPDLRIVEVNLNENTEEDGDTMIFAGPHSIAHDLNRVKEKTKAIYLEGDT